MIIILDTFRIIILHFTALKRSTSKTSLYSSRSSLYDRRRRRKGSNCSYAESVASHVRDDMSIGRHTRGYDDEFYSDESDFDGYEKPLSRRDRDRMYRSENDLGRRVKEIATQTLRETATQTGIEEPVTFESKRLVKKKHRSKSLSSSGTQTAKKEKKKKTKSTEKLDEVGKEKGKTGTKRSKSVPDMLQTEEIEKPKPKPKPRPRKSASSASHLDEAVNSGSKENLADPKNPYYPQSEGFVPQARSSSIPSTARISNDGTAWLSHATRSTSRISVPYARSTSGLSRVPGTTAATSSSANDAAPASTESTSA